MELPLFPLHTVLCPGIALPLHIFEPRYRLMTARCLSASQPFGVTWIRQGREVGTGDLAVAGVGTMAEIRDATVLPDGRYDLVAVGTRRFRIRSVTTEAAPYLVADVEPLDEVVRDEGRAERLTRLVTRRFIRYVEHVRELAADEPADDDAEPAGGRPLDAGPSIERDTGETITGIGPGPGDEADVDLTADGDPPILAIPGDPTLLSHLLSGIVELDLPRRQGLLERETTDARLVDLADILAREIAFLDGGLRLFSPDPGLERGARN